MLHLLKLMGVILVACSIAQTCFASSWFACVGGLCINRESITVRSIIEDNYLGNITPVTVTPEGRRVDGYESRYVKMSINDVRLQERTSAKKGRIGAEEILLLVSEDTTTPTEEPFEAAGTGEMSFEFNETWPTRLISRKAMGYSGAGLNDFDFAGNNGDYVGTSSTYNTRFFKNRLVDLNLTRADFVIWADLTRVTRADYLTTRKTGYNLSLKSTGITAFRYRQISSDGKHPQVEGEERYVGDLMLNNYSIFMNSFYMKPDPDEDPKNYWLDSCPYSPYRFYDGLTEVDASRIFDCCQALPR